MCIHLLYYNSPRGRRVPGVLCLGPNDPGCTQEQNIYQARLLALCLVTSAPCLVNRKTLCGCSQRKKTICGPCLIKSETQYVRWFWSISLLLAAARSKFAHGCSQEQVHCVCSVLELAGQRNILGAFKLAGVQHASPGCQERNAAKPIKDHHHHHHHHHQHTNKHIQT